MRFARVLCARRSHDIPCSHIMNEKAVAAAVWQSVSFARTAVWGLPSMLLSSSLWMSVVRDAKMPSFSTALSSTVEARRDEKSKFTAKRRCRDSAATASTLEALAAAVCAVVFDTASSQYFQAAFPGYLPTASAQNDRAKHRRQAEPEVMRWHSTSVRESMMAGRTRYCS